MLPAPPHLHISEHHLISLVPENVANVDATPVSEKDHLKPDTSSPRPACYILSSDWPHSGDRHTG